MQYIKAPFNFVPVCKKVFYPGWANQISHDVPFSDGVSGKLTLTIKAETPIFIRDGRNKEEFCHIGEGNDKEYFIPGTSIKGMIRSVLEILSFSKLDKINDHRYAIRDLHNSNVYTLMSDSENIRCGWLSLEKDESGNEIGKIRDCGIPWRISHEQLDEKFGTDFIEKFKRGGTIDFRKKDVYKTAEYKYKICRNANVEYSHAFESTVFVDNKQMCSFLDWEDELEGESIGTIVLTGQAGPSKSFDRDGNIIRGKSGKFYEFVFIEPSSESEPVIVDEKTWSEFKFHYFDYDENKISTDWKWRKGQLNRGEEIPVFFRTIDDEPKKVKDLGLSYLYKMPYKHSIKYFLPPNHKPAHFQPDLAECIFGYVNNESSLKGRVSINPARVKPETKAIPGSKIITVFGSPKASYYPTYIEQDGINGKVYQNEDNEPIYKTFMDDEDTNLAGTKRYPAKRRAIARTDISRVPEKMKVPFIPLNEGVEFATTLNYFNLRPVELGAVLSALTFHNNSEICFHGLGMGKPDGYGRISIEVEGMDKEIIKEYLGEFESEITAYLSGNENTFDWLKSPQVKELISMAKLQKDLGDRLNYMDIRIQEFAKAKSHERDNRGNITEERGFYLERYSKIVQDTGFIDTCTNLELVKEKMVNLHVQKKKQLDNERAREQAAAILIKEKETKEKEEQLKKSVNQSKKNDVFSLGQVFKALVSSDNKSVDISFIDGFINAQLVLSREQKGNPPKAKSVITVFVKQLKKTGEIVQVEWKEK